MIEYICDNCGKKDHSINFWLEINGEITNNIHGARFEKKNANMHFCSNQCLLEYLSLKPHDHIFLMEIKAFKYALKDNSTISLSEQKNMFLQFFETSHNLDKLKPDEVKYAKELIEIQFKELNHATPKN